MWRCAGRVAPGFRHGARGEKRGGALRFAARLLGVADFQPVGGAGLRPAANTRERAWLGRWASGFWGGGRTLPVAASCWRGFAPVVQRAAVRCGCANGD